MYPGFVSPDPKLVPSGQRISSYSYSSDRTVFRSEHQQEAYSWNQVDENHFAQFVVVNEPALPNWMGSCHPNGSLYEKPVDLRAAQIEHQHFRDELERHGCVVKTVRQILAQDCDVNTVARMNLEELAMRCLKYKLSESTTESEKKATKRSRKKDRKLRKSQRRPACHTPSDSSALISPTSSKSLTPDSTHTSTPNSASSLDGEKSSNSKHSLRLSHTPAKFASSSIPTSKKSVSSDSDSESSSSSDSSDSEFELESFEPSELTIREQYLLSDEYKRECIEKMDVSQLVEVVLTNPTIHLRKSAKDTELLVVNYSYEPLVNLIFCRDQQVTTAKGVVMGRLRSPIRQLEHDVMKFCFDKLGVPVLGQIEAPGTLEGGDFFPAGLDLCFVGVGLRSNMEAVEYMLTNDLFGTRRVAVVKDYFDQVQQRLHLDTVFNIIGPKLCLLLDMIQGETSPIRRLVDEYERDDFTGQYRLVRNDIEFTSYLLAEGYTIININESMQHDYGCNGLNLGNGVLITVDRTTARYIARSPHFHGSIIVVDFTNNTNMFGSVHCCSQVISRRPSKPEEISQYLRGYAAALTPKLPTISPLITKNQYILSNRSTTRYLMVAPNNFDVNRVTAHDNPFMDNAVEEFKKLVLAHPQGKRGVYAAMLEEYSLLHKLLTVDLGLNVFLATHETFHGTPDAIFVSDWLSTHPASEKIPSKKTPANEEEATLVLYSMRATNRRPEKREDLLKFLGQGYQNIINLSSCERGILRATHTLFDNEEEDDQHILLSGNGIVDQTKKNGEKNPSSQCIPFEFSSVVYDRQTKRAYIAQQAQRANPEAASLWAKSLDVELTYWDVSLGEQASQASRKLVKQLQHSCSLLYLSSRFSILAVDETVPLNESTKKLIALLKKRPVVRPQGAPEEAPVILTTLDQAAGFAVAGVQEFFDREGNSVLIMSSRAHSLYREDQLETIIASGTRIVTIEVGTIERLGGGSISGLVASLY